jgi:hypothetical protein
MAVVIVIDSQQLWQCEAGYAGFPRQRLQRLLHFDQLHRRSVISPCNMGDRAGSITETPCRASLLELLLLMIGSARQLNG